MTDAQGIDSPKAALDRFLARSAPEPNSGCWLWMGALDKDGYGRVRLPSGRKVAAHRMSYEAQVGPIPTDYTLDHKCRVRCCINPAHLEPVTNKVNVLRGDGPTARHARVTHCPLGHPYAGHNLIIRLHGRGCRECRSAVSRAIRLRRRGK